MPKGTPAHAPKININPLANVHKMPLQQAMQVLATATPKAPPPAPTVIVVAPPRPLI